MRSAFTLLMPALVLIAHHAVALDDFAVEAVDTKSVEPKVLDDLPPPPADDIEAELSNFEAVENHEPPPAFAPRRPNQVEAAPAVTPAPPPPAEAPNAAIVTEEIRGSGNAGEKIFDWSKHRGETEVAHPFAEKGLIRIDKDQVYYYKVEEGESHRAADLHAGPFNPYNLANPEDDGNFAYYDQNYNGGSPAILANYEWQVWPTAVGKMGFRAGGGLFFSQGHGHFVHLDNSVIQPLEVFSFSAFPFSGGFIYRAQLFHRQLIVPYVEGGGTLWAFMETRDDGKRPRFGGSASAYGALGAGFNLTYFDALSRISLDREYGIHAIYLIAEYRRSQTLSPHYDFSANFVNAGLLLEF